jgi:hypothetical protein
VSDDPRWASVGLLPARDRPRPRAGKIAGPGELEATLSRRDGWARGLLARKPRLGRPEEGPWYDALDDAYPTVRATLEDALSGTEDLGLVTQGAGLVWFWYYRGRMHEGARWVEAAAALFTGPEGLGIRFIRASMTMLLGRIDEAIALLAAALAEQPQPDDLALPHSLIVAAASCWTSNNWELCRIIGNRAAPLVEQLGHPDLQLVAEAVRCVPTLGSSDPDELAALASRATEIHARAVAADNICATWMLCAVRNIIALINQDPDAGVLWTERVTPPPAGSARAARGSTSRPWPTSSSCAET